MEDNNKRPEEDQNIPNEIDQLEDALNQSSEQSEDRGTDEVAALQAQADELKDKNLRLFAEFENFRKRSAKERMDLLKTASQDTLSVLLPVLDDFDRMKKIADETESKDAFMEGVLLVYNKLFSNLTSLGLRALDSDKMPFDPELHEAVTNFPVQDPDLKGKVIDTVEKGYLLNDKLIRHAKVVVGA